MSNEKISEIAIEAAKILFDNPDWTYKKSIEKAKELIEDEGMAKVEKVS